MTPYIKPFGGIDFTAVPAGTVIHDEITGREETVTEGSVVFKRGEAFLTSAMLEKVKAALATRPNTQTEQERP